MACTQVQVCCCDPDAARIYFPASVLCHNACKIYYLLYGYETCERSCAGAECRLVVFLNKSSLYLDFVSVHLCDVKSVRCTWTLVMYKGVYIFMWSVSSESRAFTCGHMAAEAFGSLNQQHVFFGVGSMHMVSREAAGLKAEAVVGYVQEKDEGKETWWIPPPPHHPPPKAFCKWEHLMECTLFLFEKLKECRTCLLRHTPPSLMFHSPLLCALSATTPPPTHKHRLIS